MQVSMRKGVCLRQAPRGRTGRGFADGELSQAVEGNGAGLGFALRHPGGSGLQQIVKHVTRRASSNVRLLCRASSFNAVLVSSLAKRSIQAFRG